MLAMDKKIATDPPVSEAQRRAMWAAKEGHSTLGIPKKVGEEFVGKDAEQKHAAGILPVTKDGRVLLLKRADLGDGHPYAGHWQLPGGLGEEGEDAEATARREYKEELGQDCPERLRAIDARETEGGRVYTTYGAAVDERFAPALDHESDGYGWFPMDKLPAPLHPALDATLKQRLRMGRDAADMEPDDWGTMSRLFLTWLREEAGEPEHAADARVTFAIDRAPENRTKTEDGHLHVRRNHISKANVCPYLGNEIPDADKLGLDPGKTYQLYRHPDELKKAAPTFNNLPILSKHVPITSEMPERHLWEGTTGTDAEWNDPYLDNSLALWTQDAVDGVESEDEDERKKELSCAYRYDADMTPGRTPDGTPYDGVMRNIRGNHVALVPTGRTGHDVVVGDSAINQETDMPKNLYLTTVSRRAAVARGALLVGLRPFLAKDAKIDLIDVIRKSVPSGITAKNWKAAKPKLIGALDAAFKGKLAKDASLEKMHGFVDSLDEPMEHEGATDDEEDEEDKDLGVTRDAGPFDRIKALLDGKIDPEELEKIRMVLEEGADAEPDEDDDKDTEQDDDATATDKEARDKAARDKAARDKEGPEMKPVTQKAMDAAVKLTEQRTVERMNAMAEAREVVRPHVGALTQAFDSAEGVLRFALEQKGYAADAIKRAPIEALRAMVAALPDPTKPAAGARLAADAGDPGGFASRFPDAQRIRAA